MRKNKLAAAVLFTVMLAMAGCPGGDTGQTQQESPAETAKDAQPSGSGSASNLSIFWWGSDNRHEATQKVLDLYTQQTGTALDVEFTGWDGYWQKLPVLAASKEVPDILQMDAAYIEQYVSNGTLADLSPYIDLAEFVGEDEVQNYLIDGKLYGVPLSRNGQGVVYSKTRLAELGIEEPKNGWTWEEMIAWGREAKKKCPEGVYPLWNMCNWYQYYQEYAQSHGGEKTLVGNQFNFDDQTYKDFMQLYLDLVEEGVCPPPEVVISFVEYDPMNDYFLNGKVLTRSISVGSVMTIGKMLPDDELGGVCLPQGEGGSGWVQSTIFLSVGAQSEHIQESADFIKWFLSDMEAGKILKTTRGLPLTDEVYEAIEPDLDSFEKLNMMLYNIITEDVVRPTPYWSDVPPAFSTWNIEFKSTGEAVMLGDMTVEEGAEYLKTLGEEAAADAK